MNTWIEIWVGYMSTITKLLAFYALRQAVKVLILCVHEQLVIMHVYVCVWRCDSVSVCEYVNWKSIQPDNLSVPCI